MSSNLTEKAMTPAEILNSGVVLQVPIYQRLFVWEQPQIEKLLTDLKNGGGKQYYIGIITINEKEDNIWEIVDGQQRLTFLTLFGAMCVRKGYTRDEWNRFLYFDTENATLRISYYGRPEDQEDIRRIASSSQEKVQNANFRTFMECFERFECKADEDKQKYFRYVLEHTSFFVSRLPRQYQPRQLNIFFEKMNSAGRQLEPVDLIKIKFAEYANRWNAFMDFDIAYTGPEPEDITSQENKASLDNILVNENHVKIEPEKPWEPHSGNQLILKPEVFLLHVLRLANGNKELSLNGNKLQEIFKNNEVDKDKFIVTMKNYRAWLDNNIIFLSASEKKYSFRKEYASEEKNDEDNAKDNSMRQFQSMLYVSSNDSQEWVVEAYEECVKSKTSLTLDLLRHQDWGRHELPGLGQMTYQRIDRYWFWKLDYLLWESCVHKTDETKQLPPKTKEIVRGYVFRRNRSIEHLQAQANAFSQDIEHSFGNLAMIAPGTNSSLSDNSINTKFGRIQDILKSKDGQLESIKLLYMFLKAEGEWTPEKVKDHGIEMYNILASDEYQYYAGRGNKEIPSVQNSNNM